jgi:DNA modification methylase
MCKDSLRHEGDPSKITVTAKEFQTNANALWEFPPETQMMDKWDHPAVFPPELPHRLIQQLTYEDDIVLDPFSGSGTTCAVAKKNRRRYIGIEMSEKYYKTSLRRLGEVAVTKKVDPEKSKAKEENKNGTVTTNNDGMIVADWME